MASQERSTRIPDRLRRWRIRMHTKHTADVSFVHINKTGGTSIEAALGLAFRHKTALELRDEMGAARWAHCFTFTVVRNPWDKVVSQYYHRCKTGHITTAKVKAPDFNSWVRLTYCDQDPDFYNNPKMFMPQTDWICDEQGNVLVDFVGRFETLEQDFLAVCRATGRTASLPHLKPSGRGDYRSIYSDDAAAIVETWFLRDITKFGYRFE